MSIHGQYTLVMTNTVTYTDRGTPQAWTPSITFVVDIKDPCKTSTISAVSLTDMTVVLGESTTQTFAEAVDSAETTYGLDSCGLRSYTIVLQSDATLTPVLFARVENINNANTNYKIISDYSLETYEGTHALSLYITMVNYPVGADGAHPKLLSNFNLVISPAVCDCKLLDWIYPTAQSLSTTVLKAVPDSITINHATVDPASKITTPAIRACYRTDVSPVGPGCDETTGSLTAVVKSTSILPGYMVLAGDVITVSPTSNAQSLSY